MNTTFEKRMKRFTNENHVPLMVNGKNLIKLQSICSQSKINIASYEKMPRYEVPEKELSFISEILGKNIEKTSWLLAAFQRKSKKNQAISDQEDSDVSIVNNPVLVAPTSLPQIKEKTLNKYSGTFKPKIKKTALVINCQKPSLENYNKYIFSMQMSNGTEITKHIREYKYFIGPGNNESLVNKVMRKKPGWAKVYTIHSAHLIWTQVKKLDVVDTLPISTEPNEKNLVPRSSGLAMFPDDEWVPLSPLTLINPSKIRVYNRVERNYELCSKKRLFINMLAYYKSCGKDPFQYIPLTFHVVNGCRDANFQAFKAKFIEIQEKIDTEHDPYLKNCWLVKPGEATNRGIGISVCSSIAEVQEKLEDIEYAPGKNRTYIIQKYVYRPLLYENRKFDIRCYLLLLCYNGNLQAFFYKDGYLRTSVAEFSLDNVHNKFIHLTNDAVQKKSSEYGKFEAGNKLNYADFQNYITSHCDNKANFFDNVFPKMVGIVKDTIAATCTKLDPKRRLHSFEILGYDFMIDEFFHPWLIEVNTNPCLALSGPYLNTLIPKMLEDAFHIALDQFFNSDLCDFSENRFVMVFNRGKEKLEMPVSAENLPSDGENDGSDDEAN